jgi:curved DNA-binding protein CbpA
LFDDNIAPIPKPDVDFGSLSAQPTPEQYFLLSRINGELTVAELCRVSGLSKEQTHEALEQLVDFGLIEIPGASGAAADEPSESVAPSEPSEASEASETTSKSEESADVSDPAMGAEPAPEEAPGINHAFVDSEASFASDTSDTSDVVAESTGMDTPDGTSAADDEADEAKEAQGASGEPRAKRKKKRRDVTPNYPVPPSEFEFDESLLSLDLPLDDEQRRQALCLYEQIDEMSFYDLFGVEADASRRDIKKAYFRLSKRYHPDKFFRKELHDFGPILERVFQEITKAYRTLSNRKKREGYDNTLARSSSSPQEVSPAAASSLAESSSRAFQDEENEQKKRKKNKKDAAALLLVRRAEKLVERDEYARAAAEYRKALALKREPQMAIDVAKLLDDQGEYPEEAISFARAALKLDPRNVEARVLLSELYAQTGRTDDAVRHLEKAVRLNPSNQEIKEKLEAMKSAQD